MTFIRISMGFKLMMKLISRNKLKNHLLEMKMTQVRKKKVRKMMSHSLFN